MRNTVESSGSVTSAMLLRRSTLDVDPTMVAALSADAVSADVTNEVDNTASPVAIPRVAVRRSAPPSDAVSARQARKSGGRQLGPGAAHRPEEQAQPRHDHHDPGQDADERERDDEWVDVAGVVSADLEPHRERSADDDVQPAAARFRDGHAIGETDGQQGGDQRGEHAGEERDPHHVTDGDRLRGRRCPTART